MTYSTSQPIYAVRRLQTYLNNKNLCAGLYGPDTTCSIGAINLALTGTIDDRIPDCMSSIIGNWILIIQDKMPDYIRNSKGWKKGLIKVINTGKRPADEIRRMDLLLNNLLTKVLPTVQPIADQGGYGPEWLQMCDKRTPWAAYAVVAALPNDLYSMSQYHISAYYAASEAAYALSCVLGPDAEPDHSASCVASSTGKAASSTWEFRSNSNFWDHINPVELLHQLIQK